VGVEDHELFDAEIGVKGGIVVVVLVDVVARDLEDEARHDAGLPGLPGSKDDVLGDPGQDVDIGCDPARWIAGRPVDELIRAGVGDDAATREESVRAMAGEARR
jgi:hypothetical protein